MMITEKTILLYTDESTAGGVAHYNHGLLPALRAAGWRTVSAQPPNDSPMLVKQRELGVEQRHISYDPCTTFARSFTDTTDPDRIMAEIQPDLVYFSDCCPLSNIAAKHVAITRKIPFVVISHSAADYLAGRFPACLPTVKGQLEKARDVIAISQKNLDVLRSHFGLAPDKGHVVLNGRPASFFNPVDPVVRQRIRAELKIPADAVLSFTSARFDAAKGYQHQLAAIRQLQVKNLLGKLYFIWAGIGEHRAEFAQAITKLGLDSRIRLLGQRWDIADLLDASDLFVLTTMLEGGLPLSVMEAMAKGVATIVTSVSGIAGVAEGACHLLPDPNTLPNDTVRALANALETFARNPDHRTKLSEAGSALAERKFHQETNLQETLAILEANLHPASIAPATAIAKATSPSALPSAPLTNPHQSEPTIKEAFLLTSDFPGQEWRETILSFLRVFNPGDPVALIIQADTDPIAPQTLAAVQENVLELVRISGKANFADIVICENPADLAVTLNHFSSVHRFPYSNEHGTTRTPFLDLLTAVLAPKLLLHALEIPRTAVDRTNSITPPPSPQRLLTIIDYAVQPYSIGDFLVYLMGSLVAAESAGVEMVDLCLLSDPSRPPIDPIMRNQVNAQNHYAHLLSFLPLAELHPQLGSLFVFDSASELNAFLAKAGGDYGVWPSATALNNKQYMYYAVFKMLREHHQRIGDIPRFRFNASLSNWADAFFREHASHAVPVTVNLRNNPHFHANRNYIPSAWTDFFERCREAVPVKFIVTCAASEVEPSLRCLPNVVFAKDHQSTLMQDLALIRFAAFHIGSSSGPVCIPIFGTQPYHIFNTDILPHITRYGGALVQDEVGELKLSFAQELQTFGIVPETADGIWQQFQKIWTSRDWPGNWLPNTLKTKSDTVPTQV